jgi:hypothetical protein
MNRSRERVVGSSMKTSSRSVQFWIEASIDEVGVVVTSERKSNAEAGVGEAQALVLPFGRDGLDASFLVVFAVYEANSDMVR